MMAILHFLRFCPIHVFTITIVSARNMIMQLYSKPEGDLDVTEVYLNLLSYSLEELG